MENIGKGKAVPVLNLVPNQEAVSCTQLSITSWKCIGGVEV